MKSKKGLESITIKVNIDHVWTSGCGCMWAFFWINGDPVLAWEGDA